MKNESSKDQNKIEEMDGHRRFYLGRGTRSITSFNHNPFLPTKKIKMFIKTFIFHTIITPLLHNLFVLYPPFNPTALSTVPLVVLVGCNLCLLSCVSFQAQELHHHMGMRVPELSSVLVYWCQLQRFVD